MQLIVREVWIVESKRKAFTLVELLVVISIIALLMSILMPALSKVRESAKKIICQSNIKQQLLACSLYMQNNNQCFPTLYDPSTGKPLNDRYEYVWGGGLGPWGVTGGGDWNDETKLLNPYVGEGKATLEKVLKLFVCPSDDGVTREVNRFYFTPTINYWTGSSYKYNARSNAFSPSLGLWEKKLLDVRNPRITILVTDESCNSYLRGFDPYWSAYWHNKKELGWGNMGFVDGRVAYIQTSRKMNYQYGDDWTYICNQTGGSR